jgi:hypothetical protein
MAVMPRARANDGADAGQRCVGLGLTIALTSMRGTGPGGGWRRGGDRCQVRVGSGGPNALSQAAREGLGGQRRGRRAAAMRFNVRGAVRSE